MDENVRLAENLSQKYVDILVELQHLRDLIATQKEISKLQHTEERRAMALASTDINRRLSEMNQFREQIANERGQFVTRDLHDTLSQTINEKLDKLEVDANSGIEKLRQDSSLETNKLRQMADDRLKALEIMRSNLEGKIWMMGAIITALLGGLQLIFRSLGR